MKRKPRVVAPLNEQFTQLPKQRQNAPKSSGPAVAGLRLESDLSRLTLAVLVSQVAVGL